MKKLSRVALTDFLTGSTILSTGGGGSYASAVKLLKKASVSLVQLEDLDPEGIVCTVFGVGGKQLNDPVKSIKLAYEVFQKISKDKIVAIIPVEIGPLASAIGIFFASKLRLPVVDADIVGMRSSPEVFLETITLKNLKREPIVIANEKSAAVLYESSSYKFTEDFLRNFAVLSGGDAFVMGYPLKVKDIKGVVGEGSITESIAIGADLCNVRDGKLTLKEFCNKNQLVNLGEGKIEQEKKNNTRGFTEGSYTIKLLPDKKAEISIKNENITVTIGGKLIVTVPDLICLLDINTHRGVENFAQNKGKKVAILARKAIAIWRTSQGRKLFSPQSLGLPFKQKLL